VCCDYHVTDHVAYMYSFRASSALLVPDLIQMMHWDIVRFEKNE